MADERPGRDAQSCLDEAIGLTAAIGLDIIAAHIVTLAHPTPATLIGRGKGEKLIAATIDCTVDLDSRQKGVHMARFPELFEEAIEGVVDDDAFLVEDLAAHVARHIVDRQEALLAEVGITARYPYERRTPVTGLSTQEMVSLIGIAAASRERVRRVVAVEANPAHDLLVLDGGALVPMVFVVSAGPGAVVVDPPEGLFDL